MRLRGKRTRSQRLQGFARMNGSVRRPTKSKTGETQAAQQEAVMLKSYQTVCTAKICHRSDDWRNHRFCRFCGSLSLRQNRHPYISLQRAEAKGKRRPQKEKEIEYR